MAVNSQCFVEWKENYVSKEKGKRVVNYFLKDVSGESVLAVVGTERSLRHMFYMVAEDFLKVYEGETSVIAGYRWKSKREVVNWLTSMLSKQHHQTELSRVGVPHQNRLARNLKIRVSDIVWSGVAWTCSKQLQHFPAFRRNGITISVQSFVYVMSEGETRHLAYLEDMYEDRKGQKKVKVRWFHHNKEVQAAIALKNSHPKEVFITPYAQVISVECVDGPALVLARQHYDKCVSTLPEDLLTRVHLCFRQFKNNRVKPFKLSKLGGYFDQPVFLILDTDFLEDEENNVGDIVKGGAKRPRSTRERGVAPCDSLCLDVKYELLRRKLIPKYVKNQRSITMPFKVNEKIELLSLDSGIRGCWFRCTIMQVTRRQFKVQYDDLKDEDGSGQLVEWVPAFRLATPDKLGIRCSGRLTTRPGRMEDEVDVAFEVGSPVDGWWSDGWWEGIVTGVGELGDGDVKVYVPGENLFLELHKKNIRASRDWMGDNWVNLETKPNILSLISGNIHNSQPETSPVSSKETLEPTIPEPVNPEPVNPEHVDHEPVDLEPVNPEQADNEPVDKFDDNKPSQKGDTEPELHKEEQYPSSALHDVILHIEERVDQGEHTSENKVV